MSILQIEITSKIGQTTQILIEQGTELGLGILKAIIIFIVGRFIIKMMMKIIKKVLNKQDIALAVTTFVISLAKVVLNILLVISIIGALGIQTTSFAALIASAGIAIGMALSGNLSNFAGGLMILIFKPIKVGDYITTSEVKGTVLEIQIFHTILSTPENIRVYIPNGKLSSGYIENYNVEKRRIEWTFGVDYGEDLNKIKGVISNILSQNDKISPDHTPFIKLHKLDASSVNIVVRVWVEAADFWDVYFDINENVYTSFNEVGINFPFPQLTLHQADK